MNEHPLKTWRNQRGISRAKLAKMAGLTDHQTVARIENGKRVSMRTLMLVCNVTMPGFSPNDYWQYNEIQSNAASSK